MAILYLLFSSIQLPDKHGITALLAAVYEDHEECVRVLVSSVSLVDCNVPNIYHIYSNNSIIMHELNQLST